MSLVRCKIHVRVFCLSMFKTKGYIPFDVEGILRWDGDIM